MTETDGNLVFSSNNFFVRSKGNCMYVYEIFFPSPKIMLERTTDVVPHIMLKKKVLFFHFKLPFPLLSTWDAMDGCWTYHLKSPFSPTLSNHYFLHSIYHFWITELYLFHNLLRQKRKRNRKIDNKPFFWLCLISIMDMAYPKPQRSAATAYDFIWLSQSQRV